MANVKRTSTATPAEITAAREMAGLTQREAAELMGVSRATIQNYERGTTAMPATAYAALLRISKK
jgi:DNA-binding transcriptional regulator YiaG